MEQYVQRQCYFNYIHTLFFIRYFIVTYLRSHFREINLMQYFSG